MTNYAAITSPAAAVTSIQQALNALGYNPGPIDGDFGRRTRKAAEDWLHNDGEAAAMQQVAAATSTGGMIYQGRARHAVDEIIVHCTATRPEWYAGRSVEEKAAEIRRWHVSDRGWTDIGYHYLIDRDGSVAKGRAETVVGAHVRGHNPGTISISLIGGFGSSETDAFSDNFTDAQDATLRDLIADIRGRTLIGKISGHNDYAQKACPGFTVSEWL
ncbi:MULTISPECIES: N-acetylmuramoyl-L-alanine amidase [unclassified Roseovarius]|uniref:peptidoglycan recognition protein family protein n=1 Tax=unclassified Roseovarius TaxID=2614913 RepID=UPI00274012CE|nr:MULTISPECIES: N-acetylmuramoyl-L-alanine amidase [unclassified Roseovarius]